MNIHKHRLQQAFSLIEISVVILVIGILIAGISRGVGLYQDFKIVTAKNLTLTSQVNRIPDLLMWLETTTEGSFIDNDEVNNKKITVWNDINPLANPNGSKFKLTSISTDYQPSFITNGIGGLPSVYFNNSKLKTVNFNLGANYTFFIVFNATTISPESAVSVLSIYNQSFFHGTLIEIYADNRVRFLHRSPMGNAGGNDNYTNAISMKRDYIYTFTRNKFTGIANCYINNIISNSAGNHGATQPEFDSKNLTFLIGSLLDFSDLRRFVGSISEIIIYDRELSSVEIKSINSYLSKKFSIKI